MPDTEILQVGISDIIARRECPRRAAYGARRHTGQGTQDHASRTPEAQGEGASYGSMMHDAIELVEDGFTDEVACQRAWDKWGSVLGPDDLTQLHDDLVIYHERDFKGVETILSEGELRMPVAKMPDGRQVYFRGRIDRLYRSLADPGLWHHVDYKSSKWVKEQKDVDDDLQLWAYNLLITDLYPEIDQLEQHYDQFRGTPIDTRKTEEKREEIRQWLATEAVNYFTPAELESDGLPAPKWNQWCPWCPILESCQIVPMLTDWALTRIDELGPYEQEHTPIDEYLSRFDQAQTAMKVLERYSKSVKALVAAMSETKQGEHGFKVYRRNNATLSPTSAHALLDAVGVERFLMLAKVSKTALEGIEDKDVRDWAEGLYEKVPGARVVQRAAQK